MLRVPGDAPVLSGRGGVSAYCFYMKRRELPTLVGALCYAFCGFALYAGVRHPYFLNSMWYFR